MFLGRVLEIFLGVELIKLNDTLFIDLEEEWFSGEESSIDIEDNIFKFGFHSKRSIFYREDDFLLVGLGDLVHKFFKIGVMFFEDGRNFNDK